MASMIIEHDFPPDVPVAVVVDCSPPSDTENSALALLEEGLTLARSDKAAGAELIQAGLQAMESIEAPHTVTPLTDDELAARKETGDADTAAILAADTAIADRQALAEKLTAGKATAAEMQTALAQLLG
jgi:hypothetical protein